MILFSKFRFLPSVFRVKSLPFQFIEFFFCADELDCAVIEKDTAAFLATARRCRRHPADYAKTSGVVVIEGEKLWSYCPYFYLLFQAGYNEIGFTFLLIV